jgi:hypothetical protein
MYATYILTPMPSSDRCPACGAARNDEEYDLYWGELRIPRWLALLISVPRRQQVDLLLIGFLAGMLLAAAALLWGLVLARY